MNCYLSESPGDSPGDADSNLFDRKSGKEVSVINEYADWRNITDKQKALKIETEIHNNLSEDITTQRGVMDWLDSIFAKRTEGSAINMPYSGVILTFIRPPLYFGGYVRLWHL